MGDDTRGVGGAAALAGVGRELFPVSPNKEGMGRSGTLARVTWSQIAAGVAVLVLVLGLVDPIAFQAPTLRAVLETVMALLALASAALLRDQFSLTQRLRELLLLSALVMLALTEFAANALPPALHLHSVTGFNAAFPVGQLVGAALLLAAARTSSDRVVTSFRRPILTAVLLTVGGFAFAELVGLLLHPQLFLSSSHTAVHQALQHPLGLAVTVCTAVCYADAAVQFSRRASVDRSAVMALFVLGALLLGMARLYYLALPSISPGEITVREILRLVAFGFIFSAVLRRDHEFRATAARAATYAERRRMARDLHDGLAQDLAFIAAHGDQISRELGAEHPVAQAVRHALAVSRSAIIELSDTKSTSPRETLEAIAHELGERFGARIVVDVAPILALTSDTRDQVSQITREAIANAARHGGARHILVSLHPLGRASVLRVVDDGSGIGRPSDQAPEGFGIRTMRERAAALGGTFSVRPAGAKGTNLEVIFR